MANNIRIRANVDDKASKPLKGISDGLDRLKKTGAQGFAIGAGAALTTKAFSLMDQALSGVIDKVGESIQAASDQREAMALSAQVFEGNADAMSKWADGASDAFGQSKREALQFAANFGTAFKAVGFDLDETADRARTMTRLASDLGSAFNTSSEEAAVALRSGLMGESEPLRRFGVFLSEAAVQSKAVELGIAKAGQKMSETQKVAARYAIIMEQTADSQGMFGRDADSLADAQKRLSTSMEDLAAEVGTELMPHLVQLTKWAREDGVPALRTVIGVVEELAGAVGSFTSFQDDALDIVPANLKGDLEDVEESIYQVSKYAMPELADSMRGGRRDIARAADATQDLEGWLDDLRDAAKKSEKAFDGLNDSLVEYFGTIIDNADEQELLRLKIDELTASLQDSKAELKELEGVKNPTADQRADIARTKQTIIETQNEIDKARIKLGTLNGASLAELRNALIQLKRNGLDPASREALTLLNRMLALRDVGFRVNVGSGSKQTGGRPGRDTGGHVGPGWSGTVGEDGIERLTMYPGGGGYVTPMAGPGTDGGSGGGSGSLVLNVTVNASPGMTPGAARELGDAVGPAVRDYLVRTGTLVRV